MKKLFASLLLLVLTVAMSAPSFAFDDTKKDDTKKTAKAKTTDKKEAKADAKDAKADAKDMKKDAKGTHKGGKMDKEKTDKKEAPKS